MIRACASNCTTTWDVRSLRVIRCRISTTMGLEAHLMESSTKNTPPGTSTTPNTGRWRVPNMPQDSKGRPYHTAETLALDRKKMQQEDLSKVKVW